MQERLEFRAWHNDKQYMYKNIAIGVGNNRIGFKLSGQKRYIWEESDQVQVSQFTGFLDSKKNQIYDGDIVAFGKNSNIITTVVWDKYMFAFQKKGTKTTMDKFAQWSKAINPRVIGNIYENPELLTD